MASSHQSNDNKKGNFIREAQPSTTGQSVTRDEDESSEEPKEQSEIEKTDYTHARKGGFQHENHVTLQGKPDKRFLENRRLSEKEITEKWSENLSDKTKKPESDK